MTYRIIKKITYSNCIKFELNGYVKFSDGNHDFIYCINKFPFKNYEEGDEIKINLASTKGMNFSTFIDQQEVVSKVFGSYDYFLSQDERENSGEEPKLPRQMSEQKQMTAYEKQVAYKKFQNTLR